MREPGSGSGRAGVFVGSALDMSPTVCGGADPERADGRHVRPVDGAGRCTEVSSEWLAFHANFCKRLHSDRAVRLVRRNGGSGRRRNLLREAWRGRSTEHEAKLETTSRSGHGTDTRGSRMWRRRRQRRARRIERREHRRQRHGLDGRGHRRLERRVDRSRGRQPDGRRDPVRAAVRRQDGQRLLAGA